ncbi:MAG: hypothetical protein ACPG5T_04910 [Endozoicomonas sp.]
MRRLKAGCRLYKLRLLRESMKEGGVDPATTGCGNVAHGAKAARLFQKEFPTAAINFVVEGCYDESGGKGDGYLKFRKIAEIPGIETVLINNFRGGGRRDCSLSCIRAEELLNAASVIVHGPSGLIKPIQDNLERHSCKMAYFNEYGEALFDPDLYWSKATLVSTGFPDCSPLRARHYGGMFLKPAFRKAGSV